MPEDRTNESFRRSGSPFTGSAEDAPIRLLLVDDDELVRIFLAEALGGTGYLVECAASGEEALQLLVRPGCDVLITDLSMPGMSGLDLIRLTRDQHPDVPKIIITGAGTLDSAIEAVKVGAYDYICKPLKIGELGLVVDRAAATRRLLLATREYQRQLQESNLLLEQRVRERTEQLLASKEELERLNRMKDEFLAHLGHELLTPLAPLKGYLSIIRQNLDDRAAVASSLEEASKEALRLQQLLEDLLELAELVSGPIRLQPMALDFNLCVRPAVEEVRQAAGKKNIRLRLELADDLPEVMVDLARTRRMVSKLLSNAVKFTEEGGSITVQTASAGERVLLRVSDSGIGIAPENLPSIFEMFHQVDGSTRRRRGGVGIGLAMVKRLAELSGGQVSVESAAGRGSTFTISLPAGIR